MFGNPSPSLLWFMTIWLPPPPPPLQTGHVLSSSTPLNKGWSVGKHPPPIIDYILNSFILHYFFLSYIFFLWNIKKKLIICPIICFIGNLGDVLSIISSSRANSLLPHEFQYRKKDHIFVICLADKYVYIKLEYLFRVGS